jgi:hypothetical protein
MNCEQLPSLLAIINPRIIGMSHIRQLIFVLFCLLNYRQDTLKIFFEHR